MSVVIASVDIYQQQRNQHHQRQYPYRHIRGYICKRSHHPSFLVAIPLTITEIIITIYTCNRSNRQSLLSVTYLTE